MRNDSIAGGTARAFRWALKPALSVLCLVLLFRHFDLDTVTNALLRANVALVVGAALGFLVLSLAAMWRWQMILRQLGVTGCSNRIALESVLIGMFFNQGLPSSVGGDLVRVWRVSYSRSSLKEVFNSVVIEKVSAVVGMVVISLLSAPSLLRIVSDKQALMAIMAANVAAAGGFVVLLFLDKLPLVRALSARRFGRIVLGISASLRRVVVSRRFLLILAWSLLIHVAVSLLFWELTLALGLQVDPAVCIMFVPIVMLITTIPISIAGWGVRESAVVVLFGFAGVSSGQAIAVSLLFGIAVAMAALPGGVIWLLTKKPAKEVLQNISYESTNS